MLNQGWEVSPVNWVFIMCFILNMGHNPPFYMYRLPLQDQKITELQNLQLCYIFFSDYICEQKKSISFPSNKFLKT
jgi:hypothetical protein